MFPGLTPVTSPTPSASPWPHAHTPTVASTLPAEARAGGFAESKHMRRGKAERCRLTLPGGGYLSLAGAGWTTADSGPRPPTSIPPTPSLMLTGPQEGLMGENWAPAAGSGSHWGHPDPRGRIEGRKPPASEFPTAEGHRPLAGGRKAQRDQGIQLRSTSQERAKLKSWGFARAVERTCPLAPLGSRASSATNDLSTSCPFLAPQSSQLSRGITIPTSQMNFKHPAECLAKSQGQGVTERPPRSAIPPPPRTLSSVLLRLLNVWWEVGSCGLLPRAQSDCHLSLAERGWKRRGRGQSPLPTHGSGPHRSCALCPWENSIRGPGTQGACTSEARRRGF